MNELICGNSIEVLKTLDDECIDLIITSPPYNLGNSHHTRNNYHKQYDDDLPEADYQQQQIDILNECIRVLKSDGSMFYNHKNRIKKGIQTTPYEWLLKSNRRIKPLEIQGAFVGAIQQVISRVRQRLFRGCRFIE